jgi:hypothetical protein
MKNFQHLSILASLVLAGSALTACNVEECESDADCDETEFCDFSASEEEGIGECTARNGGGPGPTPSGCTTDVECGAYICGNGTPRVCLTSCTAGDQCTGGRQCDIPAGATAGTCNEVAATPFTWAAVISTTTAPDDVRAANPGPDIDAIRLTSGATEVWASGAIGAPGDVGGQTCAATGTTGCVIGAAANVNGTPNIMDAAANGSCGTIAAAGNYFALGGAGGWLAVQFGGREIASGDTITVFEVANHNPPAVTGCTNVDRVRADSFTLYIGKAATAPAAATNITGSADWCLQGASAPNGGVLTQRINTSTCN